MTVIVQISDSHLVAGGAPALGRVDTRDALQRTVAHLHRLADTAGGVDAVVMTGDLTDLGEPEAYALFAETLGELPLPIFAIPGNHDRREPMRVALPGLPAEGPLDQVAEVGALTLVLLDDLVEGAQHGALSAAQLAWLDGVLEQRRARPVLLFLHHPPFATGIAHMDASALREPHGLEGVVARHPQVRLVACGHVHRMIATQWAGVPCLTAPGPSHAVTLDFRPDAPATFALEPGGVLIHRWDGRHLVSHLSPINPAPGPWRFDGREG